MKSLVQQIVAAADKWLSAEATCHEELVAWADLHGWDISDSECQRLSIRQALLNVAARQAISETAEPFATPLDVLRVESPLALTDAIHQAAHCSSATIFNFWAELYGTLIPQSCRRQIGQFATQEQIADWMVSWLLQSRPARLADIGCGAGNFLLKAAQRLRAANSTTELYGCDISPMLANLTLAAFQTKGVDMPTLAVQDYLQSVLTVGVDAIICNPPYTRHHHIPPELKNRLHAFFKARLGVDVPRQATMAIYFLLKIIAEMPVGAHAAVILPMEVLDARYGRVARGVLCQHTALFALVHFSPKMSAFHKVDVGASILLFKKGCEEQNRVRHLTLTALPTTEEFLDCLNKEQPESRELPFGSLLIERQEELPGISKWFSIAVSGPDNDRWRNSGLVVPLKHLAKVVRGIATGANEFFVLPTEKVQQYGLDAYVVRTLQRNREIQSLILDEGRWQALSDEGKNVWLLYLNGQDIHDHPRLCEYLKAGEEKGYHLRSLVRTRKRWYLMEQRGLPAIFFTILTRGNPRFILNRAGVRPLNMFSLLYPNQQVIEADATELLWALLNSRFSLSRLHSVSRTYGGNTLKVEPRELDNLPVINPLMLPEGAKQELRRYISDFYSHQQTSVLTRQVDALIETVLMDETNSEKRASVPLQLRLLEAGEAYEATAD